MWRFVVPIVLALVLLGGGMFAVWKFLPHDWLSAGPRSSPSVAATESTAEPSSAVPSATPTETPTPTPKPDPNVVKAQQALDACRAKVDAADDVISEAKKGIADWAGHIDAQRQADLGNISVDEMKARFKATRLKGPGDQKRYHDALKTYQDREEASCGKVSKAPKEIAGSLTKCAKRSDDQGPVLDAAAGGMKDWASHLAAMQRNKIQHLANAQAIWVKAYRAAPTNINAFNDAVDSYSPPTC